MWNLSSKGRCALFGPQCFMLRCALLRFVLLICIGITFSSCGFIDLRPIEYSVYPDRPDAVVAEPFGSLLVTFSTEMEREEAERALVVSSARGAVEGDRIWQGNSLYFVPLAPWQAGVRYDLGLSGTVRSRDGRELKVNLHIPFYGILRGEVPRLLGSTPSDGGSVPVLDPSAAAPRGPGISFQFSLPMKRQSLQDTLRIEGIADLDWVWADGDRIVTIYPKSPLSPWTLYRWSIKRDAQSSQGVPLAGDVSGTFVTNLDTEPPRLERTFSLYRSGPVWTETSRSLNELNLGEAIGVRFSEAMNRESLLGSLRFEPSLPGYTQQLDERTVIYVPDRPPEPETCYVLTVSADTKDASGLSLGKEYREAFTAAIPYLALVSLAADGILPCTGPFTASGAAPYAVQVLPPEGLLSINIHFSLPFTASAQRSVLKYIQLSPYFPGTLAPVALRQASWISDRVLRLVWEGLEAGSGGIAHFYRLSLSGGRSGLATDGEGNLGCWLKESLVLYLEAQP